MMRDRDDDTDALTIVAHALRLARDGNWFGAGVRVQELHQLHGADGMELLLLGLADTILVAQGGPETGLDPERIATPIWIDENGDPSVADDVPPPVRWAGRFVAARAARDYPACQALLDSCAEGEFPNNVHALLGIAAATLNLIEALDGHPHHR